MSKDRYSESSEKHGPDAAEQAADVVLAICTGGLSLGLPDSSSSYSHTITDNKTGEEFTGTGSTAEAARQDALSDLHGK
jgi:hypothetical protein